LTTTDDDGRRIGSYTVVVAVVVGRDGNGKRDEVEREGGDIGGRLRRRLRMTTEGGLGRRPLSSPWSSAEMGRERRAGWSRRAGLTVDDYGDDYG